MPPGTHQFRVLPQHLAYLARQRVGPGKAVAGGTQQPLLLSGAELASSAMLLVQCQTVQDIERDTHLLEPGLYAQTYDGPWARIGD